MSVYVAIASTGTDGDDGVGLESVPAEQEVPVSVINFLVIAALIATVVVLGLGLRSMARGGSYDREHAEKFMWERVALQALVVVLLLAAAILLNT
jgi:hypothetical protein